METEWILITEFCRHTQIETDFVKALGDEGIIRLNKQEGQIFLDSEEVPHLQRYARWYYDMEINISGIDAMRHLLNKVRMLQEDVAILQKRLGLYE